MNEFGVTNPCANIAKRFGVTWEFAAYKMEHALSQVGSNGVPIRTPAKVRENQWNNVHHSDKINWPGIGISMGVEAACLKVAKDIVRLAKEERARNANQGT